MKILVSGCSLSAGAGFADSMEDPRIWTNLLAKKMNAEVTNVSRPGYDNPGIFLNALEKLTSHDYDLILLQITALGRICVSPNLHGIIPLSATNILETWKNKFDFKTHKDFLRHFTMLNGDYEHWKRLTKIIYTAQNLANKGYNIKFVNGLLDWSKDFFLETTSRFADRILDVDNLPDHDVIWGRSDLDNDKKQIDLKLWINPFDSFDSLTIDRASRTDNHPGIESQKLFCDLIFNYLQHKKERK
jgi:hypothetical protein